MRFRSQQTSHEVAGRPRNAHSLPNQLLTRGGSQSDESDEQPVNAVLSTCERREFVSNVISASLRQLLKQFAQIVSTDVGMQRLASDAQPANAEAPICERFEGDSNVISERQLHLLKQFAQIA
jgi:hypothetical protein